MELMELTSEMGQAFEDLVKELDEWGIGKDFLLRDYEGDFEAYVQLLADWSRGQSLPDGWVPSTTYWLVDEGVIVGRSSFRHELATDFLRNIGGHIGYFVRPRRRGNGYGKVILGMTLERARQRGLDRVLVTCDEDNAASARIIEANGGVFEDTYIQGGMDVAKRRYWIELGS